MKKMVFRAVSAGLLAGALIGAWCTQGVHAQAATLPRVCNAARTVCVNATPVQPVDNFGNLGGLGGGSGTGGAVTQSGPWDIRDITGAIPLPTGASTSAAQTTANGYLSSIVSNTAGLATASGQSTANGSLSTIATNTTGLATATGQSAANSSLTSIATNTGTSATNSGTTATNLTNIANYIGSTSSPNANSTNGLLAQILVGLTDTSASHVIVDSGALSINTSGLSTSDNQLTANSYLQSIDTHTTTTQVSTSAMAAAATAAGTTATSALGAQGVEGGIPLTVGNRFQAVAVSFSRPADNNPYTVGDIIGTATTANCGSTTTGTTSGVNGCSVYFIGTRSTTGTGGGTTAAIVGARLATANGLNATYRIHYYRAAPTVTTVGDNGAYSGAVNVVAASQFCQIDVSTDDVGSDGSKGEGSPNNSKGICPFTTTSGGFVFAIVETRTAFTPTTGGTFTLTTEIYQD